ncbi:MAG: hypothetical protein WAS73_03785 [Defluviicoccus sp.]
MATKTDIDADLTLEIEGENVSPEKFVRGVRAFFGLINEVTRDLAGPDQFVQWAVQVKSGSNLVGVVPCRFTVPAGVLNHIYATVREGIESLEENDAEPTGFPELALRHVKELAGVVGTDETDDTRVRIWTKKEPTTITHKAVAHVATILQEAYEDFGAIEGRIQVISDQGQLHVFVVEPIRNRRIRCKFGEEQLPAFMDAFRKRVEVTGRIKYRRGGVPISIVATCLKEFPESKDLPNFREMRGFFKRGSA